MDNYFFPQKLKNHFIKQKLRIHTKMNQCDFFSCSVSAIFSMIEFALDVFYVTNMYFV